MQHFTEDFTESLYNSLSFLYSDVSDKMTCVEIGSFEGRGSILICEYLCKHIDSKLFCIDPFDNEYVKGNEKMAFWNSACNGQLARFRNNTSSYPKITELKGTSDNLIKYLDDNSIDFVYIDGDHSPEQVYKDAVNIFIKMKKNGIILFDDYTWVNGDIITAEGIDKFLNEYIGQYTLLLKKFQVAIQKV